MNPPTQVKKIPILPLLIALALLARSADARLAAISDFNGDDHRDYVLQNDNTYQTAIWYLDNNVLVSDVHGPTLPTNWFVVGVADFNRDGHPDYLLESDTSQTAIWYLSGRTVIAGAYGPSIPSGWFLVGIADFNGDGYPDYVLSNLTTRQTAIWYLRNNVHIGGGYGPTLPTNWWVAGVADFNRDGHPDYVLESGTSYQTAIWYLSGLTFTGAAYGPTIPTGRGWGLEGIADFNSDGYPDYVLENFNTYQTAIWYLRNNVLISGAYGPILPCAWDYCSPWDYGCCP